MIHNRQTLEPPTWIDLVLRKRGDMSQSNFNFREISEEFLFNLSEGYLAPITEKIRNDIDLDLFIRDGYINIYFKGNALLKLTEKKRGGYSVNIHRKYLQGLKLRQISDRDDVDRFLEMIPLLKENILHHGKPSLEIEYEQLIVRANNTEKRNNTDYFFIDRQYTLGNNYRIDLMGIHWPNPRRKGDKVFPCLLEIKFALNTDIRKVDQQLRDYYQLIAKNPAKVARDLKSSLIQRLELGLFDQRENRLEALKTLEISPSLEDYRFILALVDYNPRSTLLDMDRIGCLPFADQVKVLYGGFGMWERNLKAC